MEDELRIERSVDPARLNWPPDSWLASEDYFVRGYADMRGLTWSDACETLRLEQGLLVRAAGDPVAAEEVISDEERFDLDGLDLGVASSVVALSAAGCAPIASCSGGLATTNHTPWLHSTAVRVVCETS